MNYKISFLEMDKLAQEANLNKSKKSIEEMRKQTLDLKSKSISKEKKQVIKKK